MFERQEDGTVPCSSSSTLHDVLTKSDIIQQDDGIAISDIMHTYRINLNKHHERIYV